MLFQLFEIFLIEREKTCEHEEHEKNRVKPFCFSAQVFVIILRDIDGLQNPYCVSVLIIQNYDMQFALVLHVLHYVMIKCSWPIDPTFDDIVGSFSKPGQRRQQERS